MAIAKRFCICSLALSLVALNFSAISRAAIVLDLSTSYNLSNIAIGQSVTINVNLSGVLPGDKLNLLGATIAYDSSLLDLPTIGAGTIVPNPLNDPLDFLIAPLPGMADATFLTFSSNAAEQITTNGLFFSFSTTALSNGSGSFSLQFVAAGTFDPLDPFTPLMQIVDPGPDLNFQVNVAAVPESNSFVLLSMFIIGPTARTLYRSGRCKFRLSNCWYVE